MENNNQNFLEELKEYFRTTSKEQILEDWNKSQEYDKVGPTVDEYIRVQKYTCWCSSPCITRNENLCGECVEVK